MRKLDKTRSFYCDHILKVQLVQKKNTSNQPRMEQFIENIFFVCSRFRFFYVYYIDRKKIVQAYGLSLEYIMRYIANEGNRNKETLTCISAWYNLLRLHT